MSKTILKFENSHNGDTMTYELSTHIFNLTDKKQKDNLLVAINKRYQKKFDNVIYVGE